MTRIRSPRSAAFRVALVYATVSGVYIVVSDRLVAPLVRAGGAFVQTYKGLGFVLVTAAMLYALVYRYVGRQFRAREATESSERSWRALFYDNPNPMWVSELGSMRFRAVNDMAIEKYGWTAEEFFGMTLVDVHTPEERERLLAQSDEVDDYDYYRGSWKHVTKDGRALDVEVTSHSIDFEGTRCELVVVNDITERMDAQARERETRRLFETIFETAPVAVIVVDENAIVRMWNPQAARMFGWSAAEVIGKFNPVVPPERVEMYRQAVLDEFRGISMPPREAERMRADGSRVEVASYHAALKDSEGNVIGALGMFIDVSERREAERELARYREHLEEMVQERTAELERVNVELAEATRIKGDFLASMSHELRTPLNAVIGFSGVLLEGLTGPLTDDQRSQLQMIKEAGQHLLALINDVLDLSKIEAGHVSIVPVELEISGIVAEAARLVEPRALQRGLAFEWRLEEPAMVLGDPVRLKQILVNLLDNAIRYTDRGHVRVVLSVWEGVAHVGVEDTGIGIAEEDLELIFDEFRQVDRHKVGRSGGTGLGLAIARKLARMMSGDVTVMSQPAVGSTFTLTIPCAEAGCEVPEPQA